MPGLHDPAVDVLFGGRCVGCERPGRVLCATCHDVLPREAEVRWPDQPPLAMVPPYSAAVYEGLVRELVVAHKERGVRALAPVLGDLLALSVATAGATLRADGRLLLVPVPSRAASVRRRGADTTQAIVRAAASALAASGREVEVARLLRLRRGVVDQAGLDREHRRRNLHGSMAVRTGVLRAHAGCRMHVIVCDDVLTTGSTAREAQRALAQVGLPPVAIACVAATPLAG